MADPPAAISVLVVDDHTMVAQSVRRVIDGEPDMEVVAVVGTGADALRAIEARRVSVVIMDYHLPDVDGAEATTRLRAVCEDVRVLIVTGGNDEDALARALAAGCAGFLTKGRDVDELVAAVRAVARGEAVIDPGTLSRLLPRLDRDREPAGTVLSGREREVLALLADGVGSTGIAERLVISHHTARNHIRNILTKLGAHSQLEAVAIATRKGLLDHR